jgi:hypothetical protein
MSPGGYKPGTENLVQYAKLFWNKDIGTRVLSGEIGTVTAIDRLALDKA